MSKTVKKFHSCFAIDVSVSGTEAVIMDSTRCRWYVDLSDSVACSGFKSWLKTVFLKGVAQTLTVFEYECRGEAPDACDWIVKFYNLPASSGQLNG